MSKYRRRRRRLKAHDRGDDRHTRSAAHLRKQQRLQAEHRRKEQR